jgi:pimeloyl-ACP methyl ester carboxylesterase
MAATVVLVHGAWHGAWCFDRVLPLLESAGVAAIAVDLPGHGDDPGPFADLHADASRVSSVMDGIEGPIVLLGHSYGGAVITEAGVHPQVHHLVYLSALVLDAGESCATAATDEPDVALMSHAGRPNLGDAFIPSDDGVIRLTEAGARACFMNDCDEATSLWMLGRLGGQPMVTLGQPPAEVAWRHRPSTYVVCRDDTAIHPDLQRVLARRCDATVEWPTSHSPFASRPDLVADLLVEIANRT